MRRVIALGLILATLLPSAAFARGGSGNGAGGDVGPKGPEVWVAAPGADPTGNAGGSGSVICRLYDIVGTVDPSFSIGTGSEATVLVVGNPYWIACSDGYANVLIYDPANIIDPGTLARRAFGELPLIYPRPRTAPPVTDTQLVGVRTWLWVDPGDWRPMSATATIVGLSATVTAQPTKVIWNMGDGSTPVTCYGPGTPYNPSVADREQHSDCSYTYEHDGTYTVLATMVWTVSWTATNGQSGALPNVQRSTQFPLTVEQRQAVITG